MTRKEQIEERVIEACSSQDEERVYIEACEWADQTLLEKAIKWLEENVTFIYPRGSLPNEMINIEAFKEYMLG